MVPLDFTSMEAAKRLWGNRGWTEGRREVAGSVRRCIFPPQNATEPLSLTSMFMQTKSVYSSLSVQDNFIFKGYICNFLNVGTKVGTMCKT